MTSILIVDDNPIDQRLIGGLLGCVEGWRLSYANDGQDALEQARETPPDIVVTDLQMPRLDGLQLVEQLKKFCPRTPVILITSQGSEGIALDALRVGAVNYSPKRCLSRDLVRTIQKVINVSSKISRSAVVSMAPAETFDFQFEMENDTELIWPLIDQLQQNLPPWSEKDRLRIGMALDEAIANAIFHGNLEVDSGLKSDEEDEFYTVANQRRQESPYRDRRVRISAHVSPTEIRICIADQGPGFQPELIDDPRKRDNLHKLSGRGLLLIRSFMDDVKYNDIGNQITLIKRPPASDGLEA